MQKNFKKSLFFVGVMSLLGLTSSYSMDDERERERKNIVAIYNKADHYYHIEKDYYRAIELYKSVAEQNLDIWVANWACYNLGFCFQKGLGVHIPDYNAAEMWYSKVNKETDVAFGAAQRGLKEIQDDISNRNIHIPLASGSSRDYPTGCVSWHEVWSPR